MAAWGRLIGVAMLAGLAAPAAAAPLEAYGRLPAIEQAAISPDGAKLAVVVTNGEQRRIVVQDVASRAAIANLNAGEHKVRWIGWAGPKHLITLVSRTETGGVGFESVRSEMALASDLDLATGRQRPLLSGLNEHDIIGHQERDTLNLVVGPPSVRQVGGGLEAFVEGYSFVQNRGRLTLFRVDLDHGDQTFLASRAGERADGFVVGADGEPLAETEFDGATGRWTLNAWVGHWQAVDSAIAPLDPPAMLGLGRDGRSVVVTRREGGERVRREIALPSGARGAPIGDAEVDEPLFDPVDGRLIGTRSSTDESIRYTFLKPDDQAIWTAVSAAYPGARLSLESMSADHRVLVARVDSPTEGPAFALVDIAGRKARYVGDEYLGVKAGDVAPVRPIAFRAGDGLALTGYLTLPLGKPERGLPLVVLAHGGPAARDAPGFDWWSQGLASRGYAVLRVNFRGSDGLGEALLAAGYGQWGRKMQTDLSDGVADLVRRGIVDRKRVCIVGGSYGGYAALAGETLEPQIYRCAVSVAGPSDLAAMIERAKNREGPAGEFVRRYWIRYMGDFAGLAEISPAAQAAKAGGPVLLIHGKDDTVVPIEQSEAMAAALRRAGKSVEFVTLPGEDHWLSRGATRQAMLAATVTFLEKNNPP